MAPKGTTPTGKGTSGPGANRGNSSGKKPTPPPANKPKPKPASKKKG